MILPDYQIEIQKFMNLLERKVTEAKTPESKLVAIRLLAAVERLVAIAVKAGEWKI